MMKIEREINNSGTHLCEVRGQDTSLIIQAGALDTFQQLEQIVRCPPEPVRAGGGTLRRRRRQSILFGVGRGRRPPAHMLPSVYEIEEKNKWKLKLTCV